MMGKKHFFIAQRKGNIISFTLGIDGLAHLRAVLGSNHRFVFLLPPTIPALSLPPNWNLVFIINNFFYGEYSRYQQGPDHKIGWQSL